MSSSEKDWRATWLRGGSLAEVAWVGRDVLAWCSGLHLVFLDLSANRLWLAGLADDATAAGTSCLSGHFRHRVFAFAEQNLKPRIHVYAYPSMTKISTCSKGTSYAYLATTFTGDYLVSLGSITRFRLCIWSWRTGDKIASVHTPIYDAQEFGQTLHANYSTPMFIAQIGKKSGRLLTWEMTICGCSAILSENEVHLPKTALVKDVAWCPDSKDLLAIVDRDGHVYLCNSVGDGLRRIVLSQRCAVCTDIEPAAICWYRGGIVLRTTFCQIRYYCKDSSDFWRKMWFKKLTTHPCALTSHPLRNDRVFFLTNEGHVVQMQFQDDPSESPLLAVKQFIGGKYRFVDFVRPWDDYVVAIDDSMEMSVLRADVGAEISKVHLEAKGRTTSMLSHPKYPLVVVTSDNGEVIFLSVIDYRNPKILGRYWMQEQTLDLTKFSRFGRYLAVCQKNTGMCYFFDVSCASTVNVATQLDVAHRIADVLLFDTSNGLKFCVLKGIPTNSKFGYKLLLYEFSPAFSDYKISKVFCFTSFYENLHYAPGESDVFIGTPYLTKKITYFKISNWNKMELYNVTSTDHNVRQVKVFTNEKWLVTAGIDGSVVVKSLITKKRKYVHVMTYHRCDLGVSKAIINSSGDLILALGADGSFVASRYHEPETVRADDSHKNLCQFNDFDFENHESNISKYTDSLREEIVEFLSQSVQALVDSEESNDIPWIVWKQQQKIDEETKYYSEKKEIITNRFTALKSRLVDLLDENETCSELKKLPVSAFALDKFFRERKVKVAKDEREEVRNRLMSDILEMDRVSSWIQDEFWKPQKVLARSINGIFSDTEVTNYTMCKEESGKSDLFQFAQFFRSLATEFTCDDNIFPWESYTVAELKSKFEKQSRLKNTDVSQAIDEMFDDEEIDPEAKVEEKRYKELYEGITTHRFIDPCAPYYSQFKIYAYSQFLCDNYNIAEDTKRLRLYFNKHFDNMQSVKEREMNLVHDRVDRICRVSSELAVMFKEQIPMKPIYPEWLPKEKPESIIVVVGTEMNARPYVSPADQEIFDKQAIEEERARLARLADDHRERALQAMMDGVLEVRWEDVIKRDPAKPECLLAGKPVEDYTDDDGLAVERYDQELSRVLAERQKYRKILQTEYAKISAALEESIDKFNSRLDEFHLLKMKVEAAIQQLNLRHVRNFVKHVHRLNELKEIDDVKMNMQKINQKISMIEEKMHVIKNAELELQAQYENLLFKDKLMEKKLQHEFPGIGKNVFGAIFLQYKKRPRTALKNTSANEGMDLGKSITSMERLPYLTSESLDYLRQLENLDVRPAALPQSIEAEHWENLVALRRLKIAHELRVRAGALALGATGEAIGAFRRRQSELRESLRGLDDRLSGLRAERVERELDLELQLVLKLGQLEAEERGELAGAVVVPAHELDSVNRAIGTAAGRKLRAIGRSLEFARAVRLASWDHSCLATSLEHRLAILHFTRTANVTRELREYLRGRRIGRPDDKTAQRLQRDAEIKRAAQEKMVKEWQAKLVDASQEVLRVRQKNTKLNKKISKLNFGISESKLDDFQAEAGQKELKARVIKIFAKRSSIARKIIENYVQILEMGQEVQNEICRKRRREQTVAEFYDYVE